MGTDNIHHKVRRKKELQRKKATKELKALLIVCEGEKTEKNYFKSLKEHLKLTNIHIQSSPKSNPSHIVSYAKKQKAQDFKTIFCMFDTDRHKNISDAMQKIKPPLQAIISNPCFEYWILLHFENTDKPFGGTSPCNELIDTKLKKHLPDYSKNYDFSKIISTFLETALSNAKQLKTKYEELHKSSLSYTDVYLIIESIKNTQK